jgi:hypothetical protein
MNTKKAAAALNTISLGFAELSEAIEEPEGALRTAQAGSSSPAIPELPPIAEDEEGFLADLAGLPIPKTAKPVGDQGFAAICPKHRVPYKEGRYGLFCSKQTDDPAWAKVRDGKSWCSITPKNAAKYLEIRAAA